MFNIRLKSIRIFSGKTQKELADYLQISAQSVSKWEKGEALPSLEYLPLIAQFLGCSVNAFFAEFNHEIQSDGTFGISKDVLELEEKINSAFRHFNLNAEVKKIHEGRRIITFVVSMNDGVGISNIRKRSNDIIHQLGTTEVVFNTRDYDSNTFAIEIPRKDFEKISLSEALNDEKYVNSTYQIPIIIGYDIKDNLVIDDLTSLSHLIIGGRSQSGKSSFIKNIIASLASKCTPTEVQIAIIDWNRHEYQYATKYPHLTPGIINTAEKSINHLSCLVDMMNVRLKNFDHLGIQSIEEYNRKATTILPRIVLVIDELSDLFKNHYFETEPLIMQLIENGSKVGIHLIIASGYPSVEIFTSQMKHAIPSHASFRVNTNLESRVVLDKPGAESLTDCGDMLYQSALFKTITRVQVPCFEENEG